VTATTRSYLMRVLDRALIGALLFIAMVLVGVQITHAGEIVPSIGITRAVDSDNDEAKISGGLALRGNLGPFFMTEVGAMYRSEERFGGDLKIRQWPISGSLWATPLPAIYAGGGVGWYQTTFDYDSSLPLSDETTQEFGVHLGGGLKVPLAPMLGLDLSGRYVFLGDVENKISTQKLDADFWTTQLGLAIKF
jgi:hypothetical protein